MAPIRSYTTVLTLLALPNYHELLLVQPYSSRRSIGHAVVASILKNETIIENAEDVKGVLDMCHVLIKDQKDTGVGMPSHMGTGMRMGGTRQQMHYDADEMAEEQGWIARMIHLFRSDNLENQFRVSRGPFIVLKSRLCDMLSAFTSGP